MDVDVETGAVAVVRAVAVEDCGTIVNPAIVDGQIRGAVAQGIGGALLEHAVYDEGGQPQASTFLDYLLPTAAEIPPIEIEHLSSPSPFTPGGIKGMGEGGTVCPGSVLASALSDALRGYGVRFTELPITPEKVWQAIREAREGTVAPA